MTRLTSNNKKCHLMKTFRFTAIALLAISLGLSGCGEKEIPVEPTPDPKPEEVKSEIAIDDDLIQNGLTFSCEAGEKSISFTTNEDWTLSIAETSSGETWCTASATSGTKGQANVKFSVSENPSYDDRSVSVTIKSGDATKTFRVTQKGVEALLVSTSKYEINSQGGIIDIEVKANIDYEFAISESAKEWISESTSNTRALSSYKHSFVIAPSEEFDKREGEIYFKSGDKTEIVKIYQAGAGALILLSKNECYVSSAGETIVVDIRSNCEYDVQMPDVEWIKSEPKSKALSSHTLKYEILPNETYDSREAIIVFREKNGAMADTLFVTQAQIDAILLSKKEVEVNFTGGTIDVKLESNTDYELIMPEDGWVTENTTRALAAHMKTFHVSENEGAESRTCHIVFQSLTKSVADTLTINQKGKSDYLFFEEDIIYLTFNEIVTSTIKIHSDMVHELNWIEGRPNWVEIETNDPDCVSFRIKENTSIKPRSTQLVARSRTMADTLMIIQRGRPGIELSDNSFDINHWGDTITFIVDANVGYTMITPEVDWITAEIVKQEDIALKKTDITYNSTTVRLIISALDSSEDIRMEQIKFDGQPYYQTLTIKQFKRFGNSYTMEEIYRLPNIRELEELSIEGEISRTDFNFLRELAGGDIFHYVGHKLYKSYNTSNGGKLKKLDLSKATIVKSGVHSGSIANREAIDWQNENTLDYYHFSSTMIETLVLPENLDRIDWNAFEGCTELKNIIYGGSKLIYILNGAFSGCSKLEHITFPTNIRFGYKDDYHDNYGNYYSVPNDSGPAAFFKECTELISITFLGNFCFEDIDTPLFGDTQLTNLTINGNCENIAPYTFDGCKYLSGNLVFKGVTSLGKQAFGSCENITKISFENATFTSLEDCTFIYCSKLASIELPSSLQRIGKLVFAQCDALETISIPMNVNYVDEEAFSNYDSGTTNESLKAIYCYPTTPPATKSTKYGSHTILYVPKGCLEAYEKSQWGLNFNTIKEMD